eukprot:TRINITY_DN14082_c0_g1_i8.p3 TRINITY_DN14082_c0_g1~~TRINITY_DN14082_c0_g1_i8.p3  ORF type:complete len:148 (-),score=33.73 TRINITY_DN14082_c0_g1_i8:122-565(-)
MENEKKTEIGKKKNRSQRKKKNKNKWNNKERKIIKKKDPIVRRAQEKRKKKVVNSNTDEVLVNEDLDFEEQAQLLVEKHSGYVGYCVLVDEVVKIIYECLQNNNLDSQGVNRLSVAVNFGKFDKAQDCCNSLNLKQIFGVKQDGGKD